MCDDSRDLSVSPVLFSSPPHHCSSYSHAHFRRDTTTRRISNKPSTWLLHIDASESTWLLNMQVQTRPQIMPDSARHTTTTPQKSPFGVSGALSWSSVRGLCFCRGAQKGHREVSVSQLFGSMFHFPSVLIGLSTCLSLVAAKFH